MRFAWAEEPGEFRWVLIRDGGLLSVRVLWFEDGPWSSQPDERGTERLSAACDPKDFCHAIAIGAAAVRDELGVDEYIRRWVAHDFPTDQLDELLSLQSKPH